MQSLDFRHIYLLHQLIMQLNSVPCMVLTFVYVARGLEWWLIDFNILVCLLLVWSIYLSVLLCRLIDGWSWFAVASLTENVWGSFERWSFLATVNLMKVVLWHDWHERFCLIIELFVLRIVPCDSRSVIPDLLALILVRLSAIVQAFLVKLATGL